jgi:hypothetical protein
VWAWVANFVYSRNGIIANRCKKLIEYSAFVAKVCAFDKKLGNKEEAIKEAVKYCAKNIVYLKRFWNFIERRYWVCFSSNRISKTRWLYAIKKVLRKVELTKTRNRPELTDRRINAWICSKNHQAWFRNDCQSRELGIIFSSLVTIIPHKYPYVYTANCLKRNLTEEERCLKIKI